MNVGAGGAPVAFHGYYIRRIDTGTGNACWSRRPEREGFAFVAYPAEYRRSGVMTFVVDQNGVVYEKDLETDTTWIAKTMTWHTQDPTWHPVQGVSPAS